jgi:uncharacterized protein (TIGR02147 family)
MAYIFDFENYRDYLKRYYEEKRKSNPQFSYQVFARIAGLKNKSFLHNIISGKKNLTKSHIAKLSQALKHTPEEAEYFENIIHYTQAPAENEKERSYYRKQAQQISGNAKIQLVRKDQCEYYSKWYHSAIRALVEIYPLRDDYERVGKLLAPPITALQAKKSIQLLERLDFIAKGEDGVYQYVKEKKIKTSQDIPHIAKNKFHIQCTDLAKKAIRNNPPESRHAVSITMGISQETYEGIIKEIHTFRNAVRVLIDKDKNPELVYQMEILMFPLSIDKESD